MSESGANQEALQAESKVLKAINRILLERITCQTEDQLGQVCLNAAQQVIGAQYGFIGEINPMGRFDTIALSDPGWASCRLPDSEATVLIRDMEIRGIWGRVIKDETAFFTNDPASHADSVGLPEGHPDLDSFLGVPLFRNDRIVGMISLANKPGGFNAQDLREVNALTRVMVEAIHSKRIEDAVGRQAQEIMELSTLVVQIWEGVVVAPLIGTLDSRRTQNFMERFLGALVETGSSLALLDITGVPLIDTQTAQHLLESITAAKLLGVQVILTGVRPAIAQTIVHLGIDLSGVVTKSSLSAGLKECLKLLGLEVRPVGSNIA